MSEPPPTGGGRSDLELCCEGCGDSFVFTLGEQGYFQDRDLEPPKRCPACREARRTGDPRRAAVPHEDDPRAHPCDACGALTKLSFTPTAKRPVYCERCFRYR